MSPQESIGQFSDLHIPDLLPSATYGRSGATQVDPQQEVDLRSPRDIKSEYQAMLKRLEAPEYPAETPTRTLQWTDSPSFQGEEPPPAPIVLGWKPPEETSLVEFAFDQVGDVTVIEQQVQMQQITVP